MVASRGSKLPLPVQVNFVGTERPGFLQAATATEHKKLDTPLLLEFVLQKFNTFFFLTEGSPPSPLIRYKTYVDSAIVKQMQVSDACTRQLLLSLSLTLSNFIEPQLFSTSALLVFSDLSCNHFHLQHHHLLFHRALHAAGLQIFGHSSFAVCDSHQFELDFFVVRVSQLSIFCRQIRALHLLGMLFHPGASFCLSQFLSVFVNVSVTLLIV